MELRHLRAFVAVADELHFGRAAERLGIQQPPLSLQIQALERETGVSLLRRHAKGIELTFEGNQFLRHARAVVTAVSDATQAPRQARSGIAGNFSLAMTFTVAGYYLPAPLARFCRILPNVQVSLFEMDRADIERKLVAGKIDLAVILTIQDLLDLGIKMNLAASRVRILEFFLATFAFPGNCELGGFR